jgi:hypothetical protein
MYSFSDVMNSMSDADAFNLAFNPLRVINGGEPYLAMLEERKAARRNGQLWFVPNNLEARWPDASQMLSVHLQTAKGSKPTAKWLKALSGIVTEDMRDDLAALVVAMTESTFPDNGCYFDDRLKGLLWAAVLCAPSTIAPVLTRFAKDVCFRSIPGVGMNNEALGNACLVTLIDMPDGVGVPYLARLLARVKYPNVKKRIEAGLNEAAAKAGMTRAELDETSIQTHDLDTDGRAEIAVGAGAALIAIDGTVSVSLTWRTPEGKISKSLPDVLKPHEIEVKAAKARVKEIEADLAVQPYRIQRLWLDQRRWPAAVWRQRYAEHPLLGALSRRLIWNAQAGDACTPGLWQDGAFRDVNGTPVALDNAEITLWHPIGRAVAEVVAWRDRLSALAVVQPFKQAHREVYLVTDAERRTNTYSNRFAGHIVKQHQMRALAHLNGWSMILHTGIHGGPGKCPARLALPRFGLIAEYWVEAAGDEFMHQSVAHVYLATDQLRFFRPGDPGNVETVTAAYDAEISGAVVPIAEVPPLALSEVMRQCDLFIGVASITNDPTWIDAGADVARSDWRERANAYWRERSFGDVDASGETRKALLQALLPSLAIGKVSHIDGRFLRVKGRLREYKIHLGSGNILMEPNGQYLCIVPKPGGRFGAKPVPLPFEGDELLSIVLSKAALLAADDKIKDPTILSQIRR